MRLGAAVLAWALAAAGCERAAGPAPEPAPEAAPGPPAGPRASGRPDAAGAGGRRGDRHARAAARRSRVVKRVEGTLARADARQVVIRAPGAPPVTLRVAPSTTVMVGGRPAGVAALREGAEVRASYRPGDGGRPTAIAIEARDGGRPAPPARPAPSAEPEDPFPAPPSDG